jgi:ferredoxin
LDDTTTNGKARQAALRAVAEASYEPTPVVSFSSQGRLLIVGHADQVAVAVERLAPQVAAIAAVCAQGTPPSDPLLVAKAHWITAIPAQIRGHLGAFEVAFEGEAGLLGMDAVIPGITRDGSAAIDMVLDLSDSPQIQSASPPPGYLFPGDDPARLEKALSQIPDLVGSFEQPQFVFYNPDICAHARSGIEVCQRCLDACDADAISVDGDLIRVDPHLCQGAGSCATACPTGALRYNYPAPGGTLTTLQRLLMSYREAGGQDPIVLFHDAGIEEQGLQTLLHSLPESVIPVAVEEVSSLGLEIWLATLAFGAAHVAILRPEGGGAGVREIDRQREYAVALLEAMGYPGEAIQWLDWSAARSELDAVPYLRLRPAGFRIFDDKRTMLHLALGHLHGQAPAPRPLAPLPVGAPFGEVWLNAEQCTLCMACVSQCPAGALQSGTDLPQLKFVEDNCVQCGLCARSCPEDAIGPSPRYLFDDVQRRRVRMLKEDEPFCCISCGKPFATRGAIWAVLGKLQGHPMMGPAEMERLKMCEDCRIRALYAAEQQAVARASEASP